MKPLCRSRILAADSSSCRDHRRTRPYLVQRIICTNQIGFEAFYPVGVFALSTFTEHPAKALSNSLLGFSHHRPKIDEGLIRSRHTPATRNAIDFHSACQCLQAHRLYSRKAKEVKLPLGHSQGTRLPLQKTNIVFSGVLVVVKDL